ncbi:MAG TPA: O-antigen ligase family protein [Candidatus Saccharimonadales bacterium]|nr:O-antigen ligase family protein [Candidatus Saccharimonadales bacterium]
MKSVVMAVMVLVAMLPWWSGGREPIALLISAFAVVIGSIAMWRRPEPARTVASWPLKAVLTIFTAWAVLGLLWTVNRYDTEVWLTYWALALAVFILVGNLTKSAKQRLIDGYLWIATAAALYGFYQYFTGDYDRLTSSFYWANPAAAFLLPAVIIGVWRWASQRSPVALVQSAIVLIAFWLTDSRGAILVLILVAIAAATRPTVRQKSWLIITLALITFGLSLGFSWMRVHEFHHSGLTPGSRFAEAANGESTSGRDRLSYLVSSFRILAKNPVQGTGPGTFGTVHPQFQGQVSQAGSDAHNIYVQSLAEQGLIGFLLVIWIVCLMLAGLWRGVIREPTMAAVALAAVALALHFGLDIDGRYPALVVLLGALIGLVYQPLVYRKVTWKRAVGLPLLLAGLLLAAISLYQSSVWADKGKLAQDNHDLKAAAGDYSQAHTGWVYNPDYWTAEGIDYYSLAGITGGSKQYEPLALDRANHAVAVDPQDSQHYFLRARIHRLQGKLTDAQSDYNQALRLDHLNHPYYYADLASLELQMGKETDAVHIATQGIILYPQKVIDSRPADVSIRVAVSQLYTIRAAIELKNGQNAADDINHALKLNPVNTEALQLRAQAIGAK